MERTIKQDNKRNVIKCDYINDNLALECSYDEEKDVVTIGVRYVRELNNITETLFTKVSMGEYMESFYDLIRVNAAKDTIAIFKKHGTSFILDRIYDVKEHSMIPEDFKDIVFKDKFSPLKLDKNMQLVKRNKRGAVYWQV